MTKRVVDHDPLTGITTWFDYYPESDLTIVGREQDVEPFLEANKILQNDPGYSKNGIKEGWWHYAHLPAVIIEKFMNEHGVDVFNRDHDRKKYQLLNQPEYKYLKTTTLKHNVR